MAFDQSVVDKQHVVWQRLTLAQQADLEANFPRSPGTILPPAADVFGDDVDPRFEAWLDTAYYLRHAFDAGGDPFL